MNPKAYIQALLLPRPGQDVPFGGQELILGEIMAALWPCESIWLPFPEHCDTLLDCLNLAGFDVHAGREISAKHSEIAAVYFGTPTIVNDEVLFPLGDEEWTKEKERETVCAICAQCEAAGFMRIVSGLGSGDISVEERLEDMGGGSVVAVKHFDDFTDWVLQRDIA